MKYSTFRGLLIAGVVVLGLGGVIGACVLCARMAPEPSPQAVATAPTGRPATISGGAEAPKPTGLPVARPQPAPAGNLRPMDTAILQRIAQNIPGDKVKDAFPGQTYKVNLFKDAGQAGVNRLKIDLDRDEKWDEKWDIVSEGGKQEIKRQVAPADDESYTESYRLRDGSWVKK